jgi:hypothetical protein
LQSRANLFFHPEKRTSSCLSCLLCCLKPTYIHYWFPRFIVQWNYVCSGINNSLELLLLIPDILGKDILNGIFSYRIRYPQLTGIGRNTEFYEKSFSEFYNFTLKQLWF